VRQGRVLRVNAGVEAGCQGEVAAGRTKSARVRSEQPGSGELVESLTLRSEGGGGVAVPKRMWSAVTLKRRCGGMLLSRKNLAIAARAGEVRSPLDQAAGSWSPLERKPGSG
jgi:hypothetical protein